MSQEEFLKRASKTVKKRAEIKEIDIEDTFCDFAKKLNCLPLKLVLLRKSGFPDRTVLCPGGRILFIEFKRKGKGLKKNQPKWRERLIKLGFEYYVCDTIGQAERILEKFIKKSF